MKDVRLTVDCHGSHLLDANMAPVLRFDDAVVGIKVWSRAEQRTHDARVPKIVLHCSDPNCRPVQVNVDKLRAILWTIHLVNRDAAGPEVVSLTLPGLSRALSSVSVPPSS